MFNHLWLLRIQRINGLMDELTQYETEISFQQNITFLKVLSGGLFHSAITWSHRLDRVNPHSIVA